MSRVSRVVISIIVLIILSSIFFSLLSSSGEPKQLQIVVVDKDFTTVISEIQEGEEFGVYVVEVNGPSTPISDLNITFDGITHHIDISDTNTYPICILTAPQVDKDTVMDIVAHKDGYIDATKEITVQNLKKLSISPSTISVDSGEKLQVVVKDDLGKPVSGVDVKFVIKGQEQYTTATDSNGIAFFSTPSVKKDTTLFITASKEGYESVSVEGTIIHPPSSFPSFGGVLSIVGMVGVVLFIFAGVMKFVNSPREEEPESYEEKRYSRSYARVGDSSKEGRTPFQNDRPVERNISESKEIRRGVKIEEIVVGKPEIPIKDRSKKLKEQQSKSKEAPVNLFRSVSPKTKPDTWVVGTDSIRDKIDKKIGGTPMPKHDVNRWLTGTEDIVLKVDKKLKQYEDKKKKKQ